MNDAIISKLESMLAEAEMLVSECRQEQHRSYHAGRADQARFALEAAKSVASMGELSAA